MPHPTLPPARLTVPAVVGGVAATVVLGGLGLPSPELFGGLIAGIVVAFRTSEPPDIPRPLNVVAQALVGIVIGASVTTPALRRIMADWPSVVGVTVATLALSVGSGLALARLHRLDRPTGVFAMIAGGAASITAIADDLHADARVVSVLQYLRVLLVLVTLPAVVALVFAPDSSGAATTDPATPLGPSLLFTVISLVGGVAVARLIPVSTFTLLGPMLVAAVLVLGGWLGPVEVPYALTAASYALIGLAVGLKFTPASLAAIGRLLPSAVTLIVAVLVLCALLGAALSATTGVDHLTAYLATTPGGLFAVLAAATDADAEPTYVFAVQLARLLTILLLAPLLARWLRGR